MHRCYQATNDAGPSVDYRLQCFEGVELRNWPELVQFGLPDKVRKPKMSLGVDGAEGRMVELAFRIGRRRVRATLREQVAHFIHGADDFAQVALDRNDFGDRDFCRWRRREQREAQAGAKGRREVKPAHGARTRQEKGKEGGAICDHVELFPAMVLSGFYTPLAQEMTRRIGHGPQRLLFQTERRDLAQNQFDLHRPVLAERQRFENGKTRVESRKRLKCRMELLRVVGCGWQTEEAKNYQV